MLRTKKKGQSLLEYLVLITIVLGAFLAAGNYFKRGLQGRWKTAVDDLGDQYDPRVANTSIRHVLRSNVDTRLVTVNTSGGLVTTRFDVTNSIETKTGSAAVGAY